MKEETDTPMKKGKHGGARLGAGRPCTDSKLYTFRAPESMAHIIDMQANQSDFIKSCIDKAIAEAYSHIGSVYTITKSGETLHLPFFDFGIKAGFPVPLDNDEKSQDIDLLRMICPRPNASYPIHVEGDSMIDAGIHNGDIIIVDKSMRYPSPSEVAVCELNGEYTLKRFEERGEEGWLVPANPNCPEIRVTEDDDFSIWGVVTYVIHKTRE